MSSKRGRCKPIRRSCMTRVDIGKKYIDDRSPHVRKLCHGDPERCYWYRGRPLPLCVRCLFFYPSIPPGALIGALMVLFFAPSMLFMLFVVVVLTAPLVVDGMTQFYGLRRSNNLLRSITGALAGTGAGIALATIVWRTADIIG